MYSMLYAAERPLLYTSTNLTTTDESNMSVDEECMHVYWMCIRINACIIILERVIYVYVYVENVHV